MIASSIGKRFLRAYNKKYNTDYSAKAFFEQQYFTLFYDHAKYMQWVTNSPFVQGIKKGVTPTEAERAAKLARLQEKVTTAVSADASIAIGYPSTDILATTSGQITNLPIPSEEEEVYASWIGSGFGIGIQGGMSIFFDQEDILLKLFDGWQLYRKYLNTTPPLRPNQINTWNGQWLAHAYGKSFNPEEPTAEFEPFLPTKDGCSEVVTQSWVKVLFGVARQFPEKQLTGYVYNLGQTNTTIGFIPFNLPKINKPLQIYRHLFTENQYLQDTVKMEQLYGSAFGFVKACQMGAIGVSALEPKGLRGLIPLGHGKVSMPNYEKMDDTKRVTFNVYITWILAMLDNETLWQEAGNAAQTFITYEAGAKKARRDRSNYVQAALDARSKKQLLDCLTPIIEDPESAAPVVHFAKTIHMMPTDNVPYFITLVRLRYAELNKQPEKMTLNLN